MVKNWHNEAHKGYYTTTSWEQIFLSECSLRQARYEDEVLKGSKKRETEEETTTDIKEK